MEYTFRVIDTLTSGDRTLPAMQMYKMATFLSRDAMAYVPSYFASFVKKKEIKYDYVFIIFEKSRGWILEAICKEIAQYLPGTYHFHYSPNNIPAAKNYFYAHYSFFGRCLKTNPHLWNANNLIWFTHPRFDLTRKEADVFFPLRFATKILSPCSLHFEFLKTWNIKEKQMELILGAADPNMFSNKQRAGNKVIGFSSAYYERKRPDRVVGLIEHFKENQFILLGKGWLESPYGEKLKTFKNLSYVEAEYKDYPEYYSQMDVFVATSDLEGGPIPLIESMMCDVVPVACDTGFAKDLITPNANGFIFSKDASLNEIIGLVNLALEFKGAIRPTVERFSWQYFSQQVQDCVKRVESYESAI